MVSVVERMLKLHRDLPKAKTPHVLANGRRLTAYGPDRLTRDGVDGMIGLKEKRI
jgi:hypothetical protein